jgi:hypothetical protein
LLFEAIEIKIFEKEINTVLLKEKNAMALELLIISNQI